MYDGEGNVDLDMSGKAITLRSQAGAATTIIDCLNDPNTRAIKCQSGETATTRIEGLTVRSATYAVYEGGGAALRCVDASPTVVDCVFEHSEHRGAAVYCADGSVLNPAGCTFDANIGLVANREVIYCSNSSPLLERVLIVNSADAAAISCLDNSSPILTCCNLHGNPGGDWTGPIGIQLGADGNISADPQFCSTNRGIDLNWSLQIDSPCAQPQTECKTIGAGEISCGVSLITNVSWGMVKQRFR